LPFWALKLRHPTSCVAKGPAVNQETAPLGMQVTWEFAARGDLPPVTLTWRDGNRVSRRVNGYNVPKSGVMFVGSKGELLAEYHNYALLPADKFADFHPPERTIAPSIGHHAEWIQACKEGGPTTCNFDYSGALTETVLLGNVAFRTGEKIVWNAAELKVVGNDVAQALIQRDYRPGWKL
ncbi:MAG: gfo/Idh/MocA family oxidoreductase, partial [Planctomycetales bacterium]|nr:gfo/Idh/MocA family oxidoreductase [Planctomycetales bacterium]